MMSDFRDGDWALLLEVADKLNDAATNEQDCLSTLCTLSDMGEWTVDDDGREIYSASCNDDDRNRAGDRGVEPLEIYAPGDGAIPTPVARRFGLDEVNVCKSAGYILQGEDLIGRPIFQAQQEESGNIVLLPTSLQEMLSKDGDEDEDVYWKPLKWSMLQTVVDSSGGQSERFKLLAAILRRLGEAEMDSETFIPYGMQFADSDFIDQNL